VAALATLCAGAAAVHAQDPHAVLDKGAKATGLTGADVPAWHLKANYTLYDLRSGKPTETGTLEEWATGPHAWHRVYTEKKQTAQEWSTGPAKQVKSKDSKLDLARLNEAVGRPLIDPVFYAPNYKPSVEMSMQAGTFSGLTLDCVLPSNPSQAAGNINPDVLFPRLCFDIKDASLRFITTSDTMTVYSDFKPMGSRQVATKLEIKPYNRLGTEVDITTLEPLGAADQAQVTPPGNAVELPYAHQPSDTPLVPVHISECTPPVEAFSQGEHGPVSIPIVIKKDGSVKTIGSATGPQHLSLAIDGCANSYKFEPFKIDGQPVETSDVLIYDFETKPFTPTMVTLASQPPPPAKK
jgi:hypothetical protein